MSHIMLFLRTSSAYSQGQRRRFKIQLNENAKTFRGEKAKNNQENHKPNKKTT